MTEELRAALTDREPDELRDLAREVVPAEVLDPPMPDVPDGWPENLAPPKPDGPPVDLDALGDQDVAQLVLEHLDDDALRDLPEVKAAIDDPDVPIRPEVRADLEAAALGALVEAEREEAVRALVEVENIAAPSEEDVLAWYTADPE